MACPFFRAMPAVPSVVIGQYLDKMIRFLVWKFAHFVRFSDRSRRIFAISALLVSR